MNLTPSLRPFHIAITGDPSSEKTIIFLNGFGTSKDIWLQVKSLMPQDYLMICFDQIGFTGSNESHFSFERYSRFESYTEDLLFICDQLGIKKASLVGHSASGLVAAHAAVHYPERFDKLVMVGCSARYLNSANYQGGFEREDIEQTISAMKADYHGFVARFAENAMKNPERPSLSAHFASTLRGMRADIACFMFQKILELDYRSLLSELKTEVLIIQTHDDVFVPWTAALYLNKQIRNSHLVLIDATGHFPHFTAPNQVAHELQRFLN